MMPFAGRANSKGCKLVVTPKFGCNAIDGTSANVTSTVQALKTTPANAGSVNERSAKSVPLKTANRLIQINAGAVIRSISVASRTVLASAPLATAMTICVAKISISSTSRASATVTRLIRIETTRHNSSLPRNVMISLSTGTMAPLICPPMSRS